MRYIIESEAFGKIELDSETKKAYFFSGDMGYNVDNNGEFRDMVGRKFRVNWPFGKWKTCSLDINTWVEVGRVENG